MSRAALRGTAAAAVVTHAAGLLFAATAMRPGTGLQPLADRLGYLARRPLGWTLGWAAWMLAALALVAFLAALARRLGPDSARATLAVALASAGAGIDLAADTVQIGVLPQTAVVPATLFLVVERTAFLAGLVVGNGLYSIAVLLLTTLLARRRPVPRLAVLCGLVSALGGGVMVAAGFLGSARLLAASTAPAVGGVIAWIVTTTLALERDPA